MAKRRLPGAVRRKRAQRGRRRSFRAAVRDVTPLPAVSVEHLAKAKPKPRRNTRRIAAAAAILGSPGIDARAHAGSRGAGGDADEVTREGPLSFQRPGIGAAVIRRLRRGLIPIESEARSAWRHGVRGSGPSRHVPRGEPRRRTSMRPHRSWQGLSLRRPGTGSEERRQCLAAPPPRCDRIHFGSANRRRHRRLVCFAQIADHDLDLISKPASTLLLAAARTPALRGAFIAEQSPPTHHDRSIRWPRRRTASMCDRERGRPRSVLRHSPMQLGTPTSARRRTPPLVSTTRPTIRRLQDRLAASLACARHRVPPAALPAR